MGRGCTQTALSLCAGLGLELARAIGDGPDVLRLCSRPRLNDPGIYDSRGLRLHAGFAFLGPESFVALRGARHGADTRKREWARCFTILIQTKVAWSSAPLNRHGSRLHPESFVTLRGAWCGACTRDLGWTRCLTILQPFVTAAG